MTFNSKALNIPSFKLVETFINSKYDRKEEKRVKHS